jgi:hypothetical protein
MRLHITSTAGIGIVPPDATDVIRAFKDYELFNPFLLQTNGCAYSTKAAADNRYLYALHLWTE